MSTEPSILWGRNAVASQVDGHSETLGAKADADSASSLIGLTKNIKARALEIVARLGALTDTSAQDTILGRLTALGKTSDTSASSTIGGWIQLVAARLPASLSTGNLRVSLEASNAPQAVTSDVSSQADGHSVTLGATGDADTAATVIGRLKKLVSLLPASLDSGNLRVAIENTPSVTTGGLTDAQLRLTPVPVSGPLTDTQLRMTPVPISGTVSANASLQYLHDNGISTEIPHVDESDNPKATIAGPLSGFGNVLTDHEIPRIQVDFVYGHESRQMLPAIVVGGGAATVSGGLASASISAASGDECYYMTRRIVSYRGGQSLSHRFTSLFSAPVANSIQFVGVFNGADALGFGYNGTTFGIFHATGGKQHIRTLRFTAAAAGAENMTITINGNATVVASGGALSLQATAEKVCAAVDGLNNFYCQVKLTGGNVDLVVVQIIARATSGAPGAFAFSSTGTAAATWQTVTQAGVDIDWTSGFVAQTSFNVDKLDGAANGNNPTGELVNSAALQCLIPWSIVGPYLGGGTIRFQKAGDTPRLTLAHLIKYPGRFAVPSVSDPRFRLAMICISKGSTTAMSVKSASMASFLQGGELHSTQPPVVVPGITQTSIGTSPTSLLFVRLRREYNGAANNKQCVMLNVSASTETSNKAVTIQIVIDGTFAAGIYTWQPVPNSPLEYATPKLAYTAGTGLLVLTDEMTTATRLDNDLADHGFDIRLQPGEVCCVMGNAHTTTADVRVSVTGDVL